jgi:uncharacterized repeat protein (TIGR01451 family)
VGVGDVANLALTKSVAPQTADLGDTVTYTVSATNDIPVGEGGGAPTGLGTTGGVVTDTLPPGLQFVASSSSVCSAVGQTVTCHLGPIVQGQVVTTTYQAIVTSAAAGQSVTNDATIATEATPPSAACPTGCPALPDYNPNDNSDSATVDVNPAADLSLTKTVSNSNPGVDDEVDYTLTANNAGPNDATGVTITDSLPAGLDFIDASAGCDNKNGTVTCDLGTVASGASASVTIRAHTTNALAGTAITNLATVSSDDLEPNPANNQASATIDVRPLVDLSLTKVASSPTPPAGGTVDYTLTLVNNGPSPTTAATITDPLPAGLSFVSANPSQGSCSASAQTVICQLGTVPAGGTAHVVITTAIAPSAAGVTVQNTASASANDPIARPELLTSQAIINPFATPTSTSTTPTSTTTTPTSTSATPTSTTPTPTPTVNLRVKKVASNRNPTAGADVTYKITVGNDGPGTATGVTLKDPVPNGVTYKSAKPSQGSCTLAHATITCKLGTIAAGRSLIVRVTVRVDSTERKRTITNTAIVSASEHNASPSLSHAKATITAHPAKQKNKPPAKAKPKPKPPTDAKLTLTKTVNHDRTVFGADLTYTITVANAGPATAQAPKITDSIPTGISVISTRASTGRCGAGTPLTCMLGPIAPRTHATITIVARAETLGTARNTATVTTNTRLAPGSATTAAATVTIMPGPHARLLLSDSATPARIVTGATTAFHPRVSNPNPWPLHNVVVCDQLPATLMFVGASAGFSHNALRVCWTIATLPPGSSRSMTVIAEPRSGVTGALHDAVTTSAIAQGHRLTATADAEVIVLAANRCGSRIPDFTGPGPIAVTAC